MELVAEAAHRLWAAHMLADGWRPGPPGSYSPAARVHDALVPFAQLSHDDRWTVIESVVALSIDGQLLEAVEFPRGPDRPFTADEMAVGLRVASGLASESPNPAAAPVLGTVVDWAVHPRSRRLEWIRVRWDDGTVVTHSPLEGELRRIRSAAP